MTKQVFQMRRLLPPLPVAAWLVGHRGAAGEDRRLQRSTVVPDTRKDSLQRGSDRDRTPLEKLPRYPEWPATFWTSIFPPVLSIIPLQGENMVSEGGNCPRKLKTCSTT